MSHGLSYVYFSLPAHIFVLSEVNSHLILLSGINIVATNPTPPLNMFGSNGKILNFNLLIIKYLLGPPTCARLAPIPHL